MPPLGLNLEMVVTTFISVVHKAETDPSEYKSNQTSDQSHHDPTAASAWATRGQMNALQPALGILGHHLTLGDVGRSELFAAAEPLGRKDQTVKTSAA